MLLLEKVWEIDDCGLETDLNFSCLLEGKMWSIPEKNVNAPTEIDVDSEFH